MAQLLFNLNAFPPPGMHIVLEFVPNHSSDKHEWFVESSKSLDNEYRDFYTWAPGSGSGPPNDWVRVVYESTQNTGFLSFFLGGGERRSGLMKLLCTVHVIF